MSRAVVSNVQVLTAGTLYDQEASKDGKAIPSAVVTLMLTPEDAERITLAQHAGSITLTLRNPLDVVPTDTRGVRMGSLMGTPDAPPAVKNEKGQTRVVARKAVVEPRRARSTEVLLDRSDPCPETQRRGCEGQRRSCEEGQGRREEGQRRGH